MFPQLNFDDIRTQSVYTRQNKVTLEACAHPFDDAGSFSAFVRSLPDILKAKELRDFAAALATARRGGRTCILLMGAHVIKVGLAPIVIDLMERGILTHVALNSAGAIHDSESALFGVTSEDVATNLQDGSFGMWRETGDFINGTLKRARDEDDAGFGEAIGRALIAAEAPHLSYSILAAAVRLNVPVSIHAAIGTDIVHQQPSMDGAVTGEMSFRDFRVLAHSVKDLGEDAVVMNVGSAVILPEIFLKALTVVRNLGYAARGFAAANFDMIQHYRPNMNVVTRPTLGAGRGFVFTGHHEIMLPLLAAMVKERLAEVDNE
ncbi:MAG: hypothetical protein JXA28_14535 [Bacteroidetes bacterium]|nr:hypothetical protein [Bacteroidota bacterium]